MKAFDAYNMYVAIKLHFQTNYDYFKFSGKAKTSRHSFDTRRDKLIFERIAKVYDEEQFKLLLVANFLTNQNAWIGDITSEQGRQRYTLLKKRLQSLQYQFKQDLETIKSNIESRPEMEFDDVFRIVDEESNFPLIVDLMIQNDITMETFIVINKILNFMPKLSKSITDDLVWPEIAKLIQKYSPFVIVDIKVFRAIMKDVFLNSGKQKILAEEQ